MLAGALAVGARVPAGAWCAARQSAGAGPGRAGGRWAEGGVTWQGELIARGSAAPCHLLAQAARPSSPPWASTGSSKEEGAENWGGARSPGKSPRGFPERKSPLRPRGRKRGRGAKGKCSLSRPELRRPVPGALPAAEGAPNSAPRAAQL